MGLAEVHGFSHMFCSKLDIGLDPEITFVQYYEARLGGGASGEGKTRCRGQKFENKRRSAGVKLVPLKQRLRTVGGSGREGITKFQSFPWLPAREIETLWRINEQIFWALTSRLWNRSV